VPDEVWRRGAGCERGVVGVGWATTRCVVGAGVTAGAVTGVEVVLGRVELFLRAGLVAAGGVVGVVCGAAVVGGVASRSSEDDVPKTPAA
jgi:hypothetical protein